MKTHPFDAARFLDDEDSIARFLKDMCEEGDPTLIAAALGDVARARGMSAVAEKAGLSRSALYRALDKDGNPEFSTIAKVAQALGFKLELTPLGKPPLAPAENADAA
jgi:probable addiction module antidote protein